MNSKKTGFLKQRVHNWIALSCILILGGKLVYADDGEITFAINSQRLDAAIVQFSDQAGVGVLIAPGVDKSVSVRAIKGAMTARTALEQMLSDTNLEIARSEGGSLVIKEQKRNDKNSDLIDATKSNNRSSLVLEEVVVTAQKRAQSLQDVNAAVTAFSGDELSFKKVTTIEDLQALVPNLSAGSDFAFAKLFVRGIGLSSSFTGVDPSVALHVDGVVVSQPTVQLGAFFDLDRIEVLRGPQGTLYGRNATGGSFNLITSKPTEEFEGYVRFTAGNYDLVRLETALGGPISDNILGRIAFRSDSRGGYGENIVSGEDVDDSSKQALRGHLQFNLSDEVDLLLSAEWFNVDDAGLGMKFVRESFPGSTTFPFLGAGGTAPGKRDIASEAVHINDRSTWSVTATLNWLLNDNVTLKSITNYRDVDSFLRQDLDFSSNINDDVQSLSVLSEQFSEELQLIFNNDRWNGLLALYYFEEELVGSNRIHFDDSVPTGRTVLDLRGDVDIEAFAVFGNLTYNLTDQLALNVGGRYSYEERTGEHERFINFVPPSITLPFDNGGDFDDFTPSVGIEWRPSNDVLLYFTYSEGFKSGVIQTGQAIPITDPETIENYEFGLKSTLFDSRLRLNLAGFFYDFSDLQVSRTQPVAGGGFVTLFENAASAEGKGIELESTWLVTENFTLGGFLSYLDAEFINFDTDNPLDIGTNIQSLEGNKLRQSPEWSWNVRGEYEFKLQNGGTLSIGADVSYKDEQFFTEFNDDITSADAYSLFNADIKYVSPSERLTVQLWGKNITDDEVTSGAFVISTGRVIARTLLPPATYGVTFGYSF